MAALVLVVFILALVGGSDAAWCVCKAGSDAVLQKTLDYACGAGADCNPIIQSGACYNPNSVLAHCSYAANSYYQRKGQAQTACDFAGTATLTTTDPSTSGCSYPATSSAAGTSTTPGSTSPGSSTSTPGSSTSTPGSTATPSTFSPTTGTGGVLGLGPSGLSTDSDGGFLPRPGTASLFLTIFIFSVLVLLRV